jgi:hypothetical protein
MLFDEVKQVFWRMPFEQQKAVDAVMGDNSSIISLNQ